MPWITAWIKKYQRFRFYQLHIIEPFLKIIHGLAEECAFLSALVNNIKQEAVIGHPQKGLPWHDKWLWHGQYSNVYFTNIAANTKMSVHHICRYRGPRWQSGNTLASHLWGRGSVPGTASSGKAGSCLPWVGFLLLVSSALPTAHHDMTCTVLKAT